MDANATLTVALPEQQWVILLRILDETPAPHRVTHPLIVAIQQQCMAATPPQPNGKTALAAGGQE